MFRKISVFLVTVVITGCFGCGSEKFNADNEFTQEAEQIALNYVNDNYVDDASATITRVKQGKKYCEIYISTSAAMYEVEVENVTGAILEVSIKFGKASKTVNPADYITPAAAQQIALDFVNDDAATVTRVKTEKRYYEIYLSTNTARYEVEVDFAGNILEVEKKYFRK